MKNRNILGLIRMDSERKKKPKKSLDDFLLGGEDEHEEIIREKNPSKSKNKVEEHLGMSKIDEAAKKSNINVLDWGSLSKMPLREQNITLKREYLLLVEKIEEISGDLMGEKNGNNEKLIRIEKFKKESKELRDFIRAIVEFIPDGYELKMQMDTSAWDIQDIEDDVLKKIKTMLTKLRFTNQLIEDETKKERTQRQFLENELSRAKLRIKDLENSILNSAQGPVSTENSNAEAETAPEVNQNPTTNPKSEDVLTNAEAPVQDVSIEYGYSKPSDVPEDVPKYLFIETERYLEGLSEEGKIVLKVIGKTGVARNAELKLKMEDVEEGRKYFFPNNKFEYSYLNNAVKILKDRQFLSSKEVNLNARGYKFLVYELTDIGKAVYYKLTQEQPVDTEMTAMLKDHKSLEHGYLIREVANEFRLKGYTVYEDREHCTYKLDNNKRKVFDLIIQKGDEKMHIEVERGTHNDDDFLNAMDKIYQVTNQFYFVAPSDKILFKTTKGKVFKWITDRLGGFENAKGKINLHFSTLEKIKKSDEPWENFAL